MLKNYTELKNNNDLFINTIQSRKKHKNLYFKNHNTFDIEVTNYKDKDIKLGIPYLWTYAINEDIVYYGRTLDEFKIFLEDYYSLIKKYNAIQVIYIHNLSYEFQFLRKLFEWEEVFLIDIRKPLFLKYKCFEFRCSYLLTNMSLDNFLKNYDCSVQKLNYDYNKIRYPWTNLSKDEIQYCINDTIGLYECISKVLEKDNNDITNIPLTSTAYVRQDVKRCQDGKTRNLIKRLSNIDYDLYFALKSAFVGGNTHANRLYADRIINNVNCYDITSSYPYCQIAEKYPIEPFKEKVKGLNDLVLDNNFAYLLLCRFTDISLIDYFDGMPNISMSKCLDSKNVSIDNGRVLSADNILIWMTDIEFKITQYHYRFNVIFEKVYFSRYDYIPDCIKAVIYTYFENKCTLKETDPYLYMKSKNKLNSIYGMSAFDIGKQRYNYKNNDYVKDNRQIQAILNDILKNTNAAEPYAWGVWTTAHARKNLDEIIRLADDQYIYCDTDSVYVCGNLELDDINKNIMKKSEEYKVTYNNKDYYLGVWKHDKVCNRFKTLGAKKYCYEDDSGVHTVTAGISKKAGVKNIEDYEIGKIFYGATNNAWYIDDVTEINIDNNIINIPTSLYIESADYTLGITEIYRTLLLLNNEINLGLYAE